MFFMKIFITATNTNVGKTYTTKLLASFYKKERLRVGVFKPFESGGRVDSEELLKVSNINLAIDDVNPYFFELPASVYVAKKEQKIDFDKVVKSLEKIEREADVVLIEGAGGLKVPIEKDFFMVDLIEFLKVNKTLLVTSNRLGCINETILSMELLKSRDLDFLWVVNHFHESKEEFLKITYPFYKEYFKEVLNLDEDIKKIANLLLSKHPQ